MSGRGWDSKHFCPTTIDGHQMLSVSFSFPRTITRQKNGSWKGEAPTFGVVLWRETPLAAEFAVLDEVKRLATGLLDPQLRGRPK